MTRNNRRF